MIVFAPIYESEIKEKTIIPKYDGVKMSLEEFYNWVREKEPGIKYVIPMG
jgi:hypothetical protein